MQTADTNKKLKIVIIVVFTLFLGATSLLFLKSNELSETKTVLGTEITNLKADVANEITKLDAQISKNSILNAALVAKRDSLSGTLNALNKANADIKSLTKYKNSYFKLKKNINQLLADNERLQQENTSLTIEKDSVSGALSTQVAINTTLTDQMSAAQLKMNTAAKLGVAALRGSGVIIRNSGKEIATTKAWRTDNLKVCFSVPKNTLAASGDKTLYIQVIDSNKGVLGSNASKAFGSKTLVYSLETSFNYANKSIAICEYIPEPKKGFKKGTYFINVFDGATLLTTSSIDLK